MRKDEAVLAVIEAQQATIDRQLTTLENMMGQLIGIVKGVVVPEPIHPTNPMDIYNHPDDPTTPDRDPAELDWPTVLAGFSEEIPDA